ncbi:hypothetical protein Nmel_007628, partial [Mimus melanotis]
MEIPGKIHKPQYDISFLCGNLKLVYCLVPVSKLSETVETTAYPVKEDQCVEQSAGAQWRAW